VAKALYNDRVELHEFNYVPVGRLEFIAYTTSMWRAAVEAGKAAGVTELPPLNVIEVNFKKPLPEQPLEIFWGPARGLVTAKIRQCELKMSDILSTILTQRRGRE
jgi:hypothetical protein